MAINEYKFSFCTEDGKKIEDSEAKELVGKLFQDAFTKAYEQGLLVSLTNGSTKK